MIHFTIVDYWRYQALFSKTQKISDIQEKYQIRKIHQYHDKIFKEILDDKIEFINFMKRYTPYSFKENEAEKYNRKFVTSHFTAKEADIIYKVKGRNVFVIIEHQSKMDFAMPERMLEYCVELMRSVIKNRKEDESYPLICPIVLYTGKRKWSVPKTITGMQEKYYNFEPLDYPKYNLIDVNEYTIQELIEEKSSVAKAMLFEKVKTKEEMIVLLDELMKKGLEKQEIKYVRMMLTYSNDIREKLGEERIQFYKENLERKGGNTMTDVERLFIEVIDEKMDKFFAGMDEGKKEIIINMLRMKIKDKVILEAAKINHKELQKIKEELEVG